MDTTRSIVWYLTAGTRGGPNRLRILRCLRDRPYNAHQLSAAVRLDYRTVRHHLRLLEQNRLVYRPVGSGYAAPYEISPHLLALPGLWEPSPESPAVDRASHPLARRSVG